MRHGRLPGASHRGTVAHSDRCVPDTALPVYTTAGWHLSPTPLSSNWPARSCPERVARPAAPSYAHVTADDVRRVELFLWSAPNGCHAERIGDEFGAHVLGDGPADDELGIGVHDRGAVDLALECGVLGDVGDPQPVRLGDGEVAVDQVRGGLCVRVAEGAAAASPPVEALDPGVAHQPGDPLEVDWKPETEGQLGVHARGAIHPGYSCQVFGHGVSRCGNEERCP